MPHPLKRPRSTLRLATVSGVPTPADDMSPARWKGCRRPHRNKTVAHVKRLIETTSLTYAEISTITGVGRASICRWTRDAQWQRHLFAPRATDTVPKERAGARLKLRTLAARLATQAERAVRGLEAAPGVDVRKLGEALALYKMAKLATLPRKRGRYRVPLRREWDPDIDRPDQRDFLHDRPPRPGMARGLRVLCELQAGGVDLDYAPEAAVVDYVESTAYEEPALRPRKNKTKREKRQEWLHGPWKP